MPKIRVLIADDHAVLRSGLKLLVNHQQDMEVVAEAGTFGEAIRLGKIAKPDVITLDLTMPDGNGIEKVEQVCRECSAAKVLVLTMHDDPAYLRAALSAGASGYVVKQAADTELLGAIRAVYVGRVFVDLESHGSRSPKVLVAENSPDGPRNALKRSRTHGPCSACPGAYEPVHRRSAGHQRKDGRILPRSPAA